MEFEIGDVVRLKSGGPLMTIQEIDEDNTALCVYHGNGEFHQQWFNLALLVKKN